MKQKGFTLIELIIVIVVLGILAVTAAPQFINFSSDARESTVKGAQASIQGAMQLVYAKSLIDGSESADKSDSPAPEVATENGAVTIHLGYPTADAAGITKAAGLESDWVATPGAGSAAEASPAAGSIGFSPAGATVNYDGSSDSCHVLYTESTSGTNASVSVNVDGC